MMCMIAAAALAARLAGLIPLAELPNHLPPGPRGKKAHKSIGFRWARQGVGGNRLKVTQIGKALYVDPHDVEDFVARVTSARTAPETAATPSARADAVEADLRAELDGGR